MEPLLRWRRASRGWIGLMLGVGLRLRVQLLCLMLAGLLAVVQQPAEQADEPRFADPTRPEALGQRSLRNINLQARAGLAHRSLLRMACSERLGDAELAGVGARDRALATQRCESSD
ncbi:hypothetical protein RQP53_21390 [Paucibacter sp. APW11]|uniref:Uncharacterized protein n=1 Tax=Roseateles aquae TaxID=3077235 RepID=A0ABU3PGY2_9BURK|nr:hypothetical protein [Paucibacter sp. APW11]MDT9001845.1 hypothetical protein [Paucibacter sp. APW11]